jgi:hypothetical protein
MGKVFGRAIALAFRYRKYSTRSLIPTPSRDLHTLKLFANVGRIHGCDPYRGIYVSGAAKESAAIARHLKHADARLKLEEKSLLLKKLTHELGLADVPMCSDRA